MSLSEETLPHLKQAFIELLEQKDKESAASSLQTHDALFYVLVDRRVVETGGLPLHSFATEAIRASCLYARVAQWYQASVASRSSGPETGSCTRYLLSQLLLDASFLVWSQSRGGDEGNVEEEAEGAMPVCLVSALGRRWSHEQRNSGSLPPVELASSSLSRQPSAAVFYDQFSFFCGLPFLERDTAGDSATESERSSRTFSVSAHLPGAEELASDIQSCQALLSLPSAYSAPSRWSRAISRVAHDISHRKVPPTHSEEGRPTTGVNSCIAFTALEACSCPLCYAAAHGDVLVVELLLTLLELGRRCIGKHRGDVFASEAPVASADVLQHLVRTVHVAVSFGHTAVAARVARVWLYSSAHPWLLHEIASVKSLKSDCANGPRLVLHWGHLEPFPLSVSSRAAVTEPESFSSSTWSTYLPLLPSVTSERIHFTTFLWWQLVLLYGRTEGARVRIDGDEDSGEDSGEEDEEERNDERLFQSLRCLRDLFRYHFSIHDSGKLELLPIGWWYWLYLVLVQPLPVLSTVFKPQDSSHEKERITPITWLATNAAASTSPACLSSLRLIVQCLNDLGAFTTPTSLQLGTTSVMWAPRLVLGHTAATRARRLCHPAPPYTSLSIPLDHFHQGSVDFVVGRAIRLSHPTLLRLLLVSGLACIDLVSPLRVTKFYHSFRHGSRAHSVAISSSSSGSSSGSAESAHCRGEIHRLLCWATGIRTDGLWQPEDEDADDIPLHELPGTLLRRMTAPSSNSQRTLALEVGSDLVELVAKSFKHHFWRPALTRCSETGQQAASRDVLLRSCFSVLECVPFNPIAWLMILFLLYDARDHELETENGRAALLDMCHSAGHPQRIAWLQRAVEVRRLIWEYETELNEQRISPRYSFHLPEIEGRDGSDNESQGTEIHTARNAPVSWCVADSRQLLNDVVRMRCSYLFQTQQLENVFDTSPASKATSSPAASNDRRDVVAAPIPHPPQSRPKFSWRSLRHSMLRTISSPTDSERKSVSLMPSYVKVMVPTDVPPFDPQGTPTEALQEDKIVSTAMEGKELLSVFVRLSPEMDLFSTLDRYSIASGLVDTVVPLGHPFQRGDVLLFRLHVVPTNQEGEESSSILPLFIGTHVLSARFLVPSASDNSSAIQDVRLPCILVKNPDGGDLTCSDNRNETDASSATPTGTESYVGVLHWRWQSVHLCGGEKSRSTAEPIPVPSEIHFARETFSAVECPPFSQLRRALGESVQPDPLWWWRGTAYCDRGWEGTSAAEEAASVSTTFSSLFTQLQLHCPSVKRWLALENGFPISAGRGGGGNYWEATVDGL